MDLKEEELKQIKSDLEHEPNIVELGMFDIMYSEHCSYKSSRPILKLLPTEGKRVILGPGHDAGVVDVGDGDVVTFKSESHNHPSAIEPYNGAATGIGGIVRDILCMGARPVALWDPLRFGSLETSRTKWLFKYVVKGIADYGNCIGVPTVAGEVEFDKSFEQNCLVNVGCIGFGKKKDIKPSAAQNVGDILILMGGSTGRDGLGGVTFASRVLTDKSEEDRPAVQIGDPFTKKLIIEATLEAIDSGYINGLKDLGGGGFTCVCSELAGLGGTGLDINLNKVKLREKGMVPYEIVLSESQERMMFVVAPEGVVTVSKIFEKYDIPYSIVGTVTNTNRLIFNYKDKIVADIPAKMLDETPIINRESKKPKYIEDLKNIELPQCPDNLIDVVYKLIASPNICSLSYVYRQYDHEVGVRTVIKPGLGDAALLRLLDKNKGIAIATDCNSKHTYLDPYNGGGGALIEGCRNIATIGATPIAMVDCLNFGNPENPEVFWTFEQAVKGISDVARSFEVPCVGGNVSFYNEDSTTKIAVKPSPSLTVIGLIDDINKGITIPFKEANEKIVLLGKTFSELGGSEYLEYIHDIEGGIVPQIDIEREKNVINAITQIISERLITASHDCSKGGLIVALIKMSILGDLGANINLSGIQGNLRNDIILFSESHSRVILTAKKSNIEKIKKICKEYNVPFNLIGETTENNNLNIKLKNESLKYNINKMKKIYFETIPKFMGVT
ncbi:MAG: phosphoribosylformylglycinamidine synthase subunit PurL [Candidatus Lokiarchaeota archaeon]|nr:phosphoribosylformylglycinamidine synthase subunit PurL [Candidatus Lokiarchaeota archaeon]